MPSKNNNKPASINLTNDAHNRFKIKHVAISITDLDHAVGEIVKKAETKTPGYVCVTNVRATYIGNHDPEYCRILNQSFLTVPDGKPIEWFAHFSGYKQVKKTSGPDLFERICNLSEGKGFTHLFYGSTPEVIGKMEKNLLEKYKKLRVIDFVSPPFASAEELANSEIVEWINKLKPTFVWIGLGAPKQERFINLIKDRVHSSILIGVGLVFDYQAQTVKRAPLWMQRCGLEGIYRDIQQPNRVTMQTYVRLFSIIPLLVKALFTKKKAQVAA